METRDAGKLVLIVEDEAIHRLFLVTALKKRGFTCSEAESAAAARIQLAERLPDIILLDVELPDESGFALCREVKQREEYRGIPIVLLSAFHQEKAIDKGMAAGADEFISKPVEIDELILRLRTLLKIREMDRFLDPKAKMDHAQDLSYSCSEVDHLLESLIGANLARSELDVHKPMAVYVSLKIGDYSCKGRLYQREGKVLHSEDCLIDIREADIKDLGYYQDGVFLSNWQDVAESPEEYRNKVPFSLPLSGSLKNFVLYASGQQNILFINFGRRLRLFDLTWYRHLGSYIEFLAELFSRMGRKEDEYLSLVRNLGSITELKDNDFGKHRRIRRVSELLCKCLECSPAYTETLLDAVELYDIGRLLIDQSILSKEGPLSKREWQMVRDVPRLASFLLEELPRLSTAREVAANLYERFDGSGYPLGRKGQEIPFSARLIRVADVYESLRSERSFRQGYSHEESLEIIKESTEHFDPEILEFFFEHHQTIASYYP